MDGPGKMAIIAPHASEDIGTLMDKLRNRHVNTSAVTVVFMMDVLNTAYNNCNKKYI